MDPGHGQQYAATGHGGQHVLYRADGRDARRARGESRDLDSRPRATPRPDVARDLARETKESVMYGFHQNTVLLQAGSMAPDLTHQKLLLKRGAMVDPG